MVGLVCLELPEDDPPVTGGLLWASPTTKGDASTLAYT